MRSKIMFNEQPGIPKIKRRGVFCISPFLLILQRELQPEQKSQIICWYCVSK